MQLYCSCVQEACCSKYFLRVFYLRCSVQLDHMHMIMASWCTSGHFVLVQVLTMLAWLYHSVTLFQREL